MIKQLSKTIKKESAFTLLEVLVVLVITSAMMGFASYGVIKFRQTIIVSGAAKEIVLKLRQARRYSINNVATSSGYSTEGYYIELGSNDYKWGECYRDISGLQCSSSSVKSSEYTGVVVSKCKEDNMMKFIKFNKVTGEFTISNDIYSPASMLDTCTIEVSLEGLVGSTREIVINREERTIKMQ
jgi:prepilin-type N-terminal cleavage/methylation domain-containing protein